MIELEERGPVTLLRLVRGKGNALNLDLINATDEALQTLERNATRAVVLTGQGSVFGAGVDLPEMAAGGEAYIRQFVPRMNQVFERLATFPKPLVAAVNGHAIAGGGIVVMACDQRILARGKARIGLTEVLVGVQFPAWALEIARFATSPQHFSEMILTGRTYLPEEALARGLVDELVEPEQLLDRSLAVAEEMGAILPATFAATKLAVRRPLLEAVKSQQANQAAIIDYWASPEVLAMVREFVEKTIKRKS
ncbi:MAG: enoyl-CoA hydratase/isomerase family protein [Pirellulales bacterium]